MGALEDVELAVRVQAALSLTATIHHEDGK